MNDSTDNGPIYNMPLSTFILPLVIIIVPMVIKFIPIPLADVWATFGVNPLLVRSGEGLSLFLYAFVHKDALAALANAVLLLAFGASVLRAMGSRLSSFISYLCFFMVISVAAALAFCWLYSGVNVTVVGASAALSGMLGAAIRLPNPLSPSDKISKLNSPNVIMLTAIVFAYHGVMVLLGVNSAPIPIDMAWESHLTGYLVGLLMIEPWLKAFHKG